MLLSAVSVLVVAQSSSEIPEGLMNNPVYDLKIAWVLGAMKVACPTFQRFLSPVSGIIAEMRVIQVHVVSISLGRL